MPKAKKTAAKSSDKPKSERRRYLLLSGSHYENEYDEDGNNISKSYEAGEVVDSKRDLITIFGANRFKLVDDDKVVTEPAKPGEGKRLSRDERVEASRDGINKVTEEEAKAYNPNDPASKVNYSENSGMEQPPPEEELHDDEDRRNWEGTPAVRAVKEESKSTSGSDSKN